MWEKLTRSSNVQTFVQATVGSLMIFSLIMSTIQVYGAGVTLTATVSTSLTFTTTQNQFGTVNPGSVSWATTTLDILTNATNGWNITLSGDNKTAVNNNLELPANAASVTDQTEWVAGAATSTAGNSVVQASLANSGNVLAFRVMTASSSNSGAFNSTTWWGNNDNVGTAKWAGIASSTVARQIGNAGNGSYSTTDHLNTVQYYLNVATTQQTGSYSAPLTYSATGQP